MAKGNTYNGYYEEGKFILHDKFGRNETDESIIVTGSQHHIDVLDYLKHKDIGN